MGAGHVRELEDRYVVDRGDKAKLEHEIVETSLRFGVLSRFTAFVAVDRAAVVNLGGEGVRVTQAVEHPEGWGQQTLLAACAAPPNAAGRGSIPAARAQVEQAVSQGAPKECLRGPCGAAVCPGLPTVSAGGL